MVGTTRPSLCGLRMSITLPGQLVQVCEAADPGLDLLCPSRAGGQVQSQGFFSLLHPPRFWPEALLPQKGSHLPGGRNCFRGKVGEGGMKHWLSAEQSQPMSGNSRAFVRGFSFLFFLGFSGQRFLV